MEGGEKKLFFVINPIAGGRDKGDLTKQVKSLCGESTISCQIYETTGKDDKENISKYFNEVPFDAVVVAGGDGTVHMVGEHLVKSGIPLGILPAGSGNGLAKDLDIPIDIPQALDVVKAFKPKKIDTLKINGIDCFHLSDLGFNARVCHRFAESILRGKISYAWFAFQEYFKYKPFSYLIETPNNIYKGKAFMMAISNATKFGTNASINPLGEIDDGFFEISIIKPFPKILAPHIMVQLFKNRITRSPYYKIIRCKKATIYNLENESFHIDGEPVQLGKKLEVEIVPKGLEILLP